MKLNRLLQLGLLVASAQHFWKKYNSIQRIDPTLRHPKLFLVFSVREKFTLWLTRNLDRVELPPLKTVEHRIQALPSANGLVHLYYPKDIQSPAPALIWIHGGGMIAGSAIFDHQTASFYAESANLVVASVEYRLAPEHPYPAAIDDCFEALTWLIENASDLGIDPHRIAVGGMSAGGGLAAALAQRAFDAGYALKAQLLLYPMLDDASAVLKDENQRAVSWTQASNYFGWRAYLQREPGMVETRPYAVPARRKDLQGLPPAWIGIGEFDLFWDESHSYATKLEAAGVSVELLEVQGMYHAAEMIVPTASKSLEFRAAQIAFLQAKLSS